MPTDDKRLDDHIIEDRIAFTRLETAIKDLNVKMDTFKDQVNWRLLCGIGALFVIAIEELVKLITSK